MPRMSWICCLKVPNNNNNNSIIIIWIAFPRQWSGDKFVEESYNSLLFIYFFKNGGLDFKNQDFKQNPDAFYFFPLINEKKKKKKSIFVKN